MDLQEQRLTCLRMALEMGCKADSVVAVANELMTFLTGGVGPSAGTSASEEISEDAIAACGTALAASEAADLGLGQPEVEVGIPATVAVSADALPEPRSSPSEAHAVEPTSAAIAAGTESVAEPTSTTTASDASTVIAPSAEVAPVNERSLADQPSAVGAEEASASSKGQTAAPDAEVAVMANGTQGEAARAVPTAN
jgi:hypothetical protein